ncbi:HNH endonuclease [Mechercharimyces sp. CAU 1602]|uniref:HNH endonuclease n=1 Tax=Mechercharimyces sp. CAU 1602 TaxID=2973933 RepID=UPI002161B0E1|nr:HNH endonuclease [Mechercharimyces sp. CAU 1602]MCS1351681.1 HNH endonuclease [Mechercharimyces sp. CAU 1602]
MERGPFDGNGFPDFSKWTKAEVYLPQDKIVGSNKSQLRQSTRILREELENNPQLKQDFYRDIPEEKRESIEAAIKSGSVKIPGYTWHHHQEIGRMQLVPYEKHKDGIPHTGGHALWGKE